MQRPAVAALRVLACLALAASSLAAAERWVKVTAGDFTVLTPAGETAARKWAVELAQFHRGLQALVPVAPERVQPVSVVLFANDRTMEPFLPMENGKPARMGGLFVRTNDVNTIMLSLARTERETRHVVFHEAVHWHLGARSDALPLWLGEGLAELYATFALADAEHHEFGAALPGHAAQVSGGKFLPLAQLVATDRGSLLYNETRRGNVFYAEAWALTHLLVLGDNAPGPAGIARYLELLAARRPAEEAFATAFGANYAEMEDRLRRYVRRGVYRTTRRALNDAAIACTVATPTAGEIELVQGALLSGSRGYAAAEPYLVRATELDPNAARAWAQLGVARAQRAAATSDAKLFDVAADNFRRALALAPGHVAACEGLAGVVYSAATFRREDGALLAHGLALAPGNVAIETGLAALEIRGGDAVTGRQQLATLAAREVANRDSYARRILERERFKAELAEVNALTRDQRFRDAIAVLDRLLARELSVADRQVVAALHHTLSELGKAPAR